MRQQHKFGHTLVHNSKHYRACKAIAICKGCCFLKYNIEAVCTAPIGVDCFGVIFKEVKPQPKKHTFLRKIKAFILWKQHFENDTKTVYMRNLIYDTNYFNNI